MILNIVILEHIKDSFSRIDIMIQVKESKNGIKAVNKVKGKIIMEIAGTKKIFKKGLKRFNSKEAFIEMGIPTKKDTKLVINILIK